MLKFIAVVAIAVFGYYTFGNNNNFNNSIDTVIIKLESIASSTKTAIEDNF